MGCGPPRSIPTSETKLSICARMFAWVVTTPFGRLVVPLV